MNESKITLTDRLRREGRWEQACIFRDQKRREFRAAGMSKVEAREAAWEAAAAAFPPLSLPAPESKREQLPPSSLDVQQLHHRDPRRVPEWLREDVTDLGYSLDTSPQSFHSMGMYGFWRWASSHREEFEAMEWAGDEEGDDSDELVMLYDYENALGGAADLADEHQERREYENARLEASFASAFVARIENAKDFLAVRYPEIELTRRWAAGLVPALAPVVQKYMAADSTQHVVRPAN
jgi:hypothetical protein